MSSDVVCRRFVVLIDGATQSETKELSNQSNIRRLHDVVGNGVIEAANGRKTSQTVQYYTVRGKEVRFTDRFKSKATVDDTDVLIRGIVKDICSTLQRPEDELYLFGSGHGSFIARAVAGVVHNLGTIHRASLAQFDELFDSACALQKARSDDDHKKGPKLLETINLHTSGPPRIPFVGLLDDVKLTSTTITYDTSFVSSIQNVRVALALNEVRSSRAPEDYEFSEGLDMESHTFVRAWFIGTFNDMCGGVNHDGLSLYPLQWLIIEAIRTGIEIHPSIRPNQIDESTLALVFPQYAGNIPNLDGTEDIQWSFRYTNGIQVSMFDLQATHLSQSSQKDSHALRLDGESYSRHTTRKIFDQDGLKDWNSSAPRGTIIHLSVFCILDRFPKYLELNSFKQHKHDLAQFQADCVLDNTLSLPPWLQGMQLQASGVKAFRILLCGKTGVGKSTLINKVFGVEMTQESLDYSQGVHDINKAFESPSHPGLLIHDSRGWQAGSDTELELIARFLRQRAFQKDPAEALHVIWFCVDADVSRIEEADKKTFETIAQFSHDVPVFVVGTKKDKLIAFRKMQLLEEHMIKTNDYQLANRLATEEANQSAEDQFAQLRLELSQIKHYKADGYCCISKDDDIGIRNLISHTLSLIADERVRLFCVAAQVIDVDQKINSAITECMRLGTHAIRTAAVPLPFTGLIGTPTISRLICEHVLQCFGFPKATPAEVEAIMRNIVMGNLKKFMTVSLTQHFIVSAATIGVAIATAGAGAILGAAGSLLSLPPAARMLLKCSCDMILILERSFRYEGRFVSVKQIEDAARYYTTTTMKTFAGKEKRLQQHVHEEIDSLVPLKSMTIGYKFNKLRGGVEDVIYSSRFGKPPDYVSNSPILERQSGAPAELEDSEKSPVELDSTAIRPELEGDADADLLDHPNPARDSEKVLGSLELLKLSKSDPTPPSTAQQHSVMLASTVGQNMGINRKPLPPPPTVELEGDTLIGTPREELEGSTPSIVYSESSSKSRWKPSSWLRMKKSKDK